jgi:ElaB/YqjD/DUF883 family membrane-anchored ribosome-binding protein
MADHKKKNDTKNIDKRLGALRTELDALQGDMKGLAGDVADVADGRVHVAMHNAENVAERALRLAEEAAAQMADDVETWTNGNLDSVRDAVRTQPLAAAALAMGVGALLGAIFMRR